MITRYHVTVNLNLRVENVTRIKIGIIINVCECEDLKEHNV